MLTKTKSLFSVFLVLASLLFTSCGPDGGNIQIPGVDGPYTSIDGDKVVLSATFKNVQTVGEIVYDVPEYPNSSLRIGPGSEQGTIFELKVAAQDILDVDPDTLDPQTLPGGRALPNVVGGSLPAVAFQVEEFNNIVVYVGKEVFGLFIPVKLGVQGTIASYRYFIDEEKAGTISIVGADENNENAGILLLLDLDATAREMLKRIARRRR